MLSVLQPEHQSKPEKLSVEVYQAPKSELNESRAPSFEKLGKVLAWCSIFSLLPWLGAVISLIKVTVTVQTINMYGDGSTGVMAAGISKGLMPMVLCLIASLPSLVCIFLVLFFTTYRSKKFFRLWIIVVLGWVLSFPLGTLFGMTLGLILIVKRKEFASVDDVLQP